jgi:hypothetical protein
VRPSVENYPPCRVSAERTADGTGVRRIEPSSEGWSYLRSYDGGKTAMQDAHHHGVSDPEMENDRLLYWLNRMDGHPEPEQPRMILFCFRLVRHHDVLADSVVGRLVVDFAQLSLNKNENAISKWFKLFPNEESDSILGDTQRDVRLDSRWHGLGSSRSAGVRCLCHFL